MHEFASFLEINSKTSPEMASESSGKSPPDKSQYGQEFHSVFNRIVDGSSVSDPKLPEGSKSVVSPDPERQSGAAEYQAAEGLEFAMRPNSGKDLPQLALHQRALAAGRIVLTTAESKVSDVSMAAFIRQKVIAGPEMMEDPTSIVGLIGPEERNPLEGGRNQITNEFGARKSAGNVEVKTNTPETASKRHLEEKKTSQVPNEGSGSTKPEVLKSSGPVSSDLDLDRELVAAPGSEKIDNFLGVTENREVGNDLKVHITPDARVRTASTAEALSEHVRLPLIKSRGRLDPPSLNQKASTNLNVEADSISLRRDAADNFEKIPALLNRRMPSEAASRVREGGMRTPEVLPSVKQGKTGRVEFDLQEPVAKSTKVSQRASLVGSVGFQRLNHDHQASFEKGADLSQKKDELLASDLGDQSRRAVKQSQDLVNQKNLIAKSFFADAIREPIRSEAQLAQQTSPFVAMRGSDNRLKEPAQGVSIERSASAADTVADFKTELRTVLRNVQAGTEMVSADSTKNYEIWSERLAHTVASRIQAMIASNNWQLSLRLDPPSLGEIKVELQMSESGIEGKLSATDDVTRQLLQDGLQKLKIAMKDMLEPGQGLDLSVKKDGGNDSKKNDRQEKSSEISDELDIITEVASEFASGKGSGSGILDILV